MSVLQVQAFKCLICIVVSELSNELVRNQADNAHTNDRKFTHQSTMAGAHLTIQYVYEQNY